MNRAVRFPATKRGRYSSNLVDALNCAHDKEAIHRDLKHRRLPVPEKPRGQTVDRRAISGPWA